MASSPLRIDSHQHFWRFDPIRDSWITPEMAVIQRDFLPSDLQPLLVASNMDGSIAVQVDQSIKETLSLLRLAEDHPFIQGVVGWADLRSTEVADQLDYLSQFKKLKGFRHIVQSEPAGFLDEKDFRFGISLLSKHNFSYDILIYPQQLEEAIRFVSQFPNQRFVVDHLAKPPIRQGILQPWRTLIARLASAGNIYCKISGMVTEGKWSGWNQRDFEPYLDTIIEAFGPGRMMYGSDWPVCQLAASYQEQLAIVESCISQLSRSEKQAIMGENAIRFYNL